MYLSFCIDYEFGYNTFPFTLVLVWVALQNYFMINPADEEPRLILMPPHIASAQKAAIEKEKVSGQRITLEEQAPPPPQALQAAKKDEQVLPPVLTEANEEEVDEEINQLLSSFLTHAAADKAEEAPMVSKEEVDPTVSEAARIVSSQSAPIVSKEVAAPIVSAKAAGPPLIVAQKADAPMVVTQAAPIVSQEAAPPVVSTIEAARAASQGVCCV